MFVTLVSRTGLSADAEVVGDTVHLFSAPTQADFDAIRHRLRGLSPTSVNRLLAGEEVSGLTVIEND